jgi:hypothetical protein
VDETTDYIVKLFRFQIESANYEKARPPLKLLAGRLSALDLAQMSAELRTNEIRAFVAERQIEYLVHFTRIENVTSILQYGLLPRDQLEKILGPLSRQVIVNDHQRFDEHQNASCLTISFPNY